MSTSLTEAYRRPERATSVIGKAIETVLHWHALTSGRRQLAGLDDRMLRDIGPTRADVDHEYHKPFWRT